MLSSDNSLKSHLVQEKKVVLWQFKFLHFLSSIFRMTPNQQNLAVKNNHFLIKCNTVYIPILKSKCKSTLLIKLIKNKNFKIPEIQK